MTIPSTLAAGLTKGQRRALLAADESGKLPRDYPRMKPTGRHRISLPTLLNLERLDVIVFHPPRLTDLGKSVRAYLEENGDE